LDEWGDWLSGITGMGLLYQQCTLMDALSAGEHLNVFMEYTDRIQVVCLAQVINVIHALFLTQPNRGLMVKTPSFYVFKMYKPHHTNGAKWAPHALTSENITGGGKTMPVLTAGTSVDKDGNVNISLTNIDLTNARSIAITLASGKPGYVVDSAHVVTGPAKNSYNDFGKPEVVNIKTLPSTNYSISGKTLNVTVPSKSVVMVRLKPTTTQVIGQREARQEAAAEFSITARPYGKVLVSSSVARKTPVTISVYGADGRVLIRKLSQTFLAGGHAVVLGDELESSGIRIVTISGDGFSISKRIPVSN
jgi:hypothetical protein